MAMEEVNGSPNPWLAIRGLDPVIIRVYLVIDLRPTAKPAVTHAQQQAFSACPMDPSDGLHATAAGARLPPSIEQLSGSVHSSQRRSRTHRRPNCPWLIPFDSLIKRLGPSPAAQVSPHPLKQCSLET